MTLVEVVIAFAIVTVTVGGIITGYNYCLTSSVKDGLYMAANARAMERMEEARSAQWDTSPGSPADYLATSNFPPQVVILDKYAMSSNAVTATLKTQIFTISTKPPVRGIHVDCIWQFQDPNTWITNSVETCRSPDQ